jgi:hypothetical protein
MHKKVRVEHLNGGAHLNEQRGVHSFAKTLTASDHQRGPEALASTQTHVCQGSPGSNRFGPERAQPSQLSRKALLQTALDAGLQALSKVQKQAAGCRLALLLAGFEAL